MLKSQQSNKMSLTRKEQRKEFDRKYYEKNKERLKVIRDLLENKLKRKIYNEQLNIKAKKKLYNQRPDVKARKN